MNPETIHPLPEATPPPPSDAPPHSALSTPRSDPATPHSALCTPHSNGRRNGKIARLPQPLRELLNVMLRDGAPYADIIKTFAEKGHSLTDNNLSRWYSGGHQDWLKEQAWLEETRARIDFATQLVREENADFLNEASLRIALVRMYNLLLDFDPTCLKENLAGNAGAYSRLLNALCKLTDGALRLERRRAEKKDEQSLRRNLGNTLI